MLSPLQKIQFSIFFTILVGSPLNGWSADGSIPLNATRSPVNSQQQNKQMAKEWGWEGMGGRWEGKEYMLKITQLLG